MKNLASGTQIPDTILNDLCYQYRYDGRDNLVERKFPTKGWDYMVYDKADRLVASQDANLKAQNKWLVVKYEMFGRVVYTGLITAGSRQSLQNQVSNIVVKETKDAVGFVKSGITVNYTNSF